MSQKSENFHRSFIAKNPEDLHNEERHMRRNIDALWFERHNALKQIFNGKSKAIMHPHIAEQYAMIKRGKYLRDKHADSLIKTHGIRKPRTRRSTLRKLDMHALFTIFTFVWTTCEVRCIYKIRTNPDLRNAGSMYFDRFVDYYRPVKNNLENLKTNYEIFEVLFCDMQFTRESYCERYGPRNFSVQHRCDDFQPCKDYHNAVITHNITCYILDDGLELIDGFLRECIAGKSYAKTFVCRRYKYYTKCNEIEHFETRDHHYVIRNRDKFFNWYVNYEIWLTHLARVKECYYLVDY